MEQRGRGLCAQMVCRVKDHDNCLVLKPRRRRRGCTAVMLHACSCSSLLCPDSASVSAAFHCCSTPTWTLCGTAMRVMQRTWWTCCTATHQGHSEQQLGWSNLLVKLTGQTRNESLFPYVWPGAGSSREGHQIRLMLLITDCSLLYPVKLAIACVCACPCCCTNYFGRHGICRTNCDLCHCSVIT
jgi:hypothetical protein